MKRRHGCIVCMCTSSCPAMPWHRSCAESTVNNRTVVGPELQVAMAKINSYVSGYHAYVESNNSRASTEFSYVYNFSIAVVLENEIVGHLPIPWTSCLTVFKKGL